MQHHVEMIRHYRVGKHRNGKGIGQFQNAIFYPSTAVLEAASRYSILPAQEGPTDTTRNHVVEPGLLFRNEMAAWIGHGSIVAEGIIDVDGQITRWQVGNFLGFVPVLSAT